MKKIGETATHIILEHPEGHIMHMVKRGVGKGPKGATQHLAKGGDVKKPQPTATPTPTSMPGTDDERKKIQDSFNNALHFANGGDTFNMPEDMVAQGTPDDQVVPQEGPQGIMSTMNANLQGNMPAEQPQEVAQQPTNPQLPQGQQMPMGDIYGTGATFEALQKGIGETEKGLRQEAGARGAQGNEEARVLGLAQTEQANNKATYQDHLSNLNTEREQFINDLANTHVDPNHLWADKSTGSKIATIAGILIGGLGGSDAPMKMLQTNIDRDIAAQQANLGTKKSLLEANLHQFGNLKDATEMTRVMLNDSVSLGLQRAAAQSKNPMAQAALNQALGKLHMDSSNILGALAAKKALTSGNAASLPPEVLVNLAVPKERQADVIKSYANIEGLESFRTALKDSNKQLDAMVGHGMLSPNARQAILGNLAGMLSRATAGRYNEAEAANQINSVLHGRFEGDATRAIKGRNIDTLVDIERAKEEAPIKQFPGLPLPKRAHAGFSKR